MASRILSLWAPGFVAPLLCLGCIVLYGVRFQGRIGARAGWFVAAVLVAFVALASPIGVLARGYLFSAHMLQHLLLVLAVPPLALLGMPDPEATASASERPPSSPFVPWLAGVAAMWVWHAGPLCNAAATSSTVGAIQTVSLVAMGLAFWRPIMSRRPTDRMPPLSGVLYLFAACVACTILGIVITFSPVEVCSTYAQPVDTLGILPFLREDLGMSCKADQQIGGLLMWVPACLVYSSAILAMLHRYYAEEGSLQVTGGRT